MFRRIIIAFIVVFFIVSEGFAFWIWTPKSEKWTNPKWTAKDTPKAQLEFAKGVLDSGEYKKALLEFRKVLRHYPEALEAADAQFYIGDCLRGMDKPYDAYLAYQKVIDKYSFSDKMDMILERQFDIAEYFTEEKAKILGLAFSQEYYAILVYKKIIENSPYSKLAALSQYRIGLVLKSANRFDEAKEEFEKLITSYPDSEWFQAAKFQVALCASSASLGPDYDQELTQEAKEKFQDFVRKFPEAQLSQETREKIAGLRDKEAEKDFKVGEFYEKQEDYLSARMYYEDVIRNYRNSIWTEKSKERIKILEREKKL